MSTRSIKTKVNKFQRSKSSISVKNTKRESHSSVHLDNTLERLLDEENTYQMICSIREEIVNEAINQAYDKYLEKTKVGFIVHCLAEAWKRMLNFAFMKLDKEILKFDTHPMWENEAPPEPSEQDSWASHSVQIAKAGGEVKEEIIEIVEPVSMKSSEIGSELLDESQIETLVPMYIMDNEELTGAEEECTKSTYTDSEKYEQVSSDTSFFTTIVQAPCARMHLISTSAFRSSASQDNPEDSLPIDSTIKLTPSFFTKLPAIRLHSKFKSETGKKSQLNVAKLLSRESVKLPSLKKKPK